MQVKIGNGENQVINTNLQTQEKAAQGGRREAVKRKNTIFAGDLPINKDPITLRRQQAQKKAMKFVQDAWAGDRKLDQSQEDIRAKLKEQLEEVYYNKGLAQSNTKRMENLREEYGVDADSQEQKDLDLLMKAAHPDPSDPLTEEDKARLEKLKEQPRTVYQQKCLEIKDEGWIYELRAARAQNYAQELQSALTDMKIERLKYHKMADAQEKADQVMEQASEEIVGLLVSDAKDHVDETYEEQREAAEKKAEEKEEQEEKLEKIEKQKELIEVRTEVAQAERHEAEEAQREREKDARDDAQLMKNMADAGMDVAGAGASVKAEIKDMLQKMKLIEADIKGIEVNEEI